MKEKDFCRCCLSEECYKDMDNTYYIGDKTENYFEMLVNIFNVNLRKDDTKRSLICEDCVSKLRDGAAFKKQVLEIQESIKNNFSWNTIGSEIATKLEDDYIEDFNDNINENDILWENFTDDGSEKGTDTDDFNIDEFGSDEELEIPEKSRPARKRSVKGKIVAVKPNKATQDKDKVNKRREKSQTEIVLKYKSENTLKLIQNSNLCLFRSLRNKFGCNYCPLTFAEFIQLREHSLSHKNPTLTGIKRLRGLSCKNADISDLKCSLCSQNCTDLQNLMDHLKKEHDFTFHGTGHYLVPYKLQDGNQCVLCELKFNTYLRLLTHMNSHYKNNVCEKCGLSFINRSGLRTHVQAQHQEKKCPRCPAIFLTAAAKSKHLKKAHGIWNAKRLYCNVCNKCFKHNYMLVAHKINEHGARRPEPSICVLCGKKFMSHLNLKTHVRSVHVKERNFPCSKCGMRFFTSCDQRRHERTHEDVRSFSCNYCDAKFKSKDSWRRHLKRQHGHEFSKATAT